MANSFREMLEADLNQRARIVSAGSDIVKGDYDRYLKLVDELTDYMHSEGIFNIPLIPSQFINLYQPKVVRAHINQRGVLNTTEIRGHKMWLKKPIETNYDLRDLSDMMLLKNGERVVSLGEVSPNDIHSLRSLIDSSFRDFARERYFNKL